MVDRTATKALHATLAANTVDVVTLAECEEVEVFNSGTAALYFTIDGTTPTVRGSDTYMVAPGGGLKLSTDAVSRVSSGGRFDIIGFSVKLISSAAGDYSVTAVP